MVSIPVTIPECEDSGRIWKHRNSNFGRAFCHFLFLWNHWNLAGICGALIRPRQVAWESGIVIGILQSYILTIMVGSIQLSGHHGNILVRKV